MPRVASRAAGLADPAARRELPDGSRSLGSGHDDVLVGAGPKHSCGNLVDDHMFEAVAVNVRTQSVTLQNPWNGTNNNRNVQMQFDESLTTLAQDNAGLFFAFGARAQA